jgi:hypothetical protein
MMVQAKAICLFEDVRVKFSDPKATFMVSNGWFHIIKAQI